METTMPTVRSLFDSPRVYLIPNYQRTYVWNQFDQWEPLWLDVVNVAETLMAQQLSFNIVPLKPHFLGAAVLKEITRPGENIRKFVVVDGQQRLITIQLLLAALGNSFSEHEGLSSLLDTAHSFTVNWISGRLYEEEPDKVKPLAGDFLLFTKIMEAGRNCSPIPSKSGVISDCYEFYSSKVAHWLTDTVEFDLSIEERARYLLTAITDQLQVVAIWLTGENEATIFEALNARGEPLSEWEKVKNLVLAKAGEIPSVSQGEIYERYLLEFDQPKWRELTGRTPRRISDVFLDYWLESKVKRAVDTRRVYREFRLELDKPENARNLESWCAELNRDGRRFLELERSALGKDEVEETFHGRRRRLEIGAIWPFLLALMRLEIV